MSSPWASGLVILITVLWTIPTFGLLITSLRPSEQAQNSGWWTFFTDPTVTLSNYSEVITGGAVDPQWHRSLLLQLLRHRDPRGDLPAGPGVRMAAYAFAWIPFKGSTFVFFTIFALQVIPLQMSLLPLLTMFNKGWSLGPITIFPDLNKPGSDQSSSAPFIPLWVAHTMFALPLAIFLLHNFINQLPRELFEAARVDGASHFLIFRKLVLPLTVPAIASFAIFQFLWVWNDLLVALVFSGPDVAPLTVKLVNLVGQRGEDWHLLSAGAFVSLVIPLAVFLGLQRYFVRGLLAGSVKG